MAQPPKPMGNDGTVFRCPICKTILPNINVHTFPFCCDRCRLLDLNNWIEGKYTLSRPIDPTDELEDLRKSPQLPKDPGEE
jgi:endogenous inhibitor of DNA gyrase (YacG/DUF329 family)